MQVESCSWYTFTVSISCDSAVLFCILLNSTFVFLAQFVWVKLFIKEDELFKFCILSTNLTSEFSPIEIWFLYWQKLFSVVEKNKISIGFSTTVFLSTEIVKPFWERALLSCNILSVVVLSNSEKPVILTPFIVGVFILYVITFSWHVSLSYLLY